MTRSFNISKRYFIVLLIAFFQIVSLANNPYLYRHRVINNSNGLSNGAVTCIFQDHKGYMWFGTWDGLNRYNGSEITVFRPGLFKKGSLSNNIIRNIFEDGNKNLWVVTEDGLNRFKRDPENFQKYLTGLNAKPFIENRFKTTLLCDSIVTCAVYRHGLFLFDGDDFRKLKSDTVSLDKILGIYSYAHKIYALNEDNTLAVFRYENNRLKLIRSHLLSEKIPVNSSFTKFLVYQNELWLAATGVKNELLLIKAESGELYKIGKDKTGSLVTAISDLDDAGKILIGTDAGHILSLDLNDKARITDLSKQFPETTKPAVKIWCINNSNPDISWIGTDGYGIMEYYNSGKDFRNISSGDGKEGLLNHKIIRAVLEDKQGNIYAGTRGAGLNCIRKTDGKTIIYDKNRGLSDNAVLSLAEDGYSNLWIGIDGEGIDMLDIKTHKILHFPKDFSNSAAPEFGHVYSICKDSYGDIWLGTSGSGVIRLNIKRQKDGTYQLVQYQQILSSENGLQSNIVYSIVETEPNVLWIGTRGGGVQRYNTLTGSFEIFRAQEDKESIPNDDVLTLFMASTQELWVGSSGGLTLINQSFTPYKFVHYNHSNGLPSNTVHAIQQDDNGKLWISTNNGLSRLDPENGEFWNFNNSDGLTNYEYSDNSSCKGQNSGQLFFGGTNGIDIFHPESIKLSDNTPPLVFKGFYLNQKKQGVGGFLKHNIDMTDTIMLEYDQNFFGFDFTSLNYHNKSKASYAYKLEDFNKEWVIMNGENIAFFTNVPHGHYVFNVRWTNEDNIWSHQTRKIHIFVNPPWWKTWWAYLLYFFIFLMITGLVIATILYRHKIKTNIRIKEIELNTAKQLHQYKLQFFTNIAHEFRTPLTLIMAPAIHLLSQQKKMDATVPYLQSIHENSRRLMHLIGELTEFRKVESSTKNLKIAEQNIFQFTEHIYKTFLYYAQSHNIAMELKQEGKKPMGWIDSNVIEKVLINLISNAIKFTPANGNILIHIKITDNEKLIIEVKDSGVGFPKHLESKIFDRFFYMSNEQNAHKNQKGSGVGLALTKSLVQLHKGSIAVNSQPKKGSTFTVELPIGKDQYPDEKKDNGLALISEELEQKISDEFVASEQLFTSNESTEDNHVRKANILIADDNPEIRHLIIRLMGKEYNFTEAENGQQALKLLQKQNIDLIISDIIMPEMDGMNLCRIIKEDFDTCHIPIILLTAKGKLEDRIEGINVGADSFIPKPFDPRHLRARINQLIEVREKIRSQIKESPEDSGKQLRGLDSKDARFMKKLQDYINKNLSNPELDADMMKDELGLSKTLLYTKIKALTTLTPHGYLKHCRLKKAGQLLLHSDANVSEIIYDIGFNNRTYFYRAFKEMYACSPKDYQARHL